jgi:hypothetical protein
MEAAKIVEMMTARAIAIAAAASQNVADWIRLSPLVRASPRGTVRTIR